MKKNIVTCICTLLSSVCSVVYSQTEIEIDSKKTIEKATNFYDEKKFDEAIAEYKKVNKNDTNYVLSLLGLVYTYESSNKDSLAVITCNEILQTPSPYGVKALLYKAYALDNQKKYDESAKCYEEGIKKYPLNNLFYYDYGRIKYNQKKYKEAHDLFVKSIMYNPYHGLSHLLMGNLAIKQGKLIPAILAYQFYLLIDNSSESAKSVVTELEKLVKIEDEFKDVVKVEGLSEQDDFSELESLVKSKVALSSKYKSQTKLNFNITKQLQLISEKMVVNKEDKGFYMQFYAPIIAEQYKHNYLEPYSYYILGGMSIEEVDKWLKKNQKITDEWIIWFNKYVGENFATFETVLNDKKIKARHWYNDSYKISSVGNTDALGGNIGYWNFYYGNGILQTEGGYDDKNQRDGVWKFYDKNQTLKDIERYSHGKLSGKAEAFYPNGSIYTSFNYSNGLLDGLQTIYYSTGVKKNEYEYKAGEVTKERSFHKTGQMEYEISLVNKKYEGDFIRYYDNGHIKEKSFLKEGNREGKYESYYNIPEKQLQSEGTYEKGALVGEWKSYHQNGKLEETGMLDKESLKKGAWKNFYDNGIVKSEELFSKGENDGILKYYSTSGKIEEEFLYKNNILQEYKAFDPSGKIIHQSKKDGKNNYNLELFHPNGNKRREGKIVNGKRHGLLKEYDLNGYLNYEVTYVDGKKHGKEIYYYPNGKVKNEREYVDGQTHGYYKEYYKNGKLTREGAYVDDMLMGLWVGYHADGSKDYESFYKDDEKDGWQNYYTVEGKISYEDNIELEYLKKRLSYDSIGKVFEVINFDKGSANLDLKYFNGKQNRKGVYKNNLLQGKYESYFGNGHVWFTNNYVNGYLEGERKQYFPDGALANSLHYVNGEMQGKQTYYFEDGNVDKEFDYMYGQKTGKMINYYSNKQIESDASYKNNVLDGPSIMYSETGEIAIKRNYENGRLVSYTYNDKSGNLIPPVEIKNETANIKAYYKSGTPSLEYSLKNGEKEGKRISYYSNGKIYEEDNYVWGELNGLSKQYYPSGTIKSEERYSDDEKNGKCVYYHENGKIKSEQFFINDLEHGTFKYYDINGKLIKTRIYYNGEMTDEI